MELEVDMELEEELEERGTGRGQTSWLEHGETKDPCLARQRVRLDNLNEKVPALAASLERLQSK